ncbi:hypothetical protein C6A85_16785, partial [Mycobacterium sp. ITM-2017-0098]
MVFEDAHAVTDHTAEAGAAQPAVDDKVVTAWNGLAITALSDASFTLNRPEYLGAAIECADAVLDL